MQRSSSFESSHPIASTTTRDHIAEDRGQVNVSKAELFIAQIILFGSWLKDATAPLWSSALTRIISPMFGVISSVFSTIFAWKEFYKSRHKHALAAAIVETVAGAAIIVAAIGIMASIAALSFVTPILLIAAIGTKSLFSLGSSVYHFVEARHARKGGNNDAAAVNISKARHDAIEGLMTAAITAAAVVLMLFAAPVIQTVMLSVAVGAAGLGLIHCLYKIFTNYNKNTATAESAAMNNDTDYTRDSSTDLILGRQLGHRSGNSIANSHQENAGLEPVLENDSSSDSEENKKTPQNQPPQYQQAQYQQQDSSAYDPTNSSNGYPVAYGQ